MFKSEYLGFFCYCFVLLMCRNYSIGILTPYQIRGFQILSPIPHAVLLSS